MSDLYEETPFLKHLDNRQAFRVKNTNRKNVRIDDTAFSEDQDAYINSILAIRYKYPPDTRFIRILKPEVTDKLRMDLLGLQLSERTQEMLKRNERYESSVIILERNVENLLAIIKQMRLRDVDAPRSYTIPVLYRGWIFKWATSVGIVIIIGMLIGFFFYFSPE